MLRRAKEFARNHWKKVLFGGVAIQVAHYGIKYATNRFLEYQDDQARLYWKKIKKQQHFESLEENCMSTYRQLVQVLKQTINETLDADTLLENLKNNQVENKLAAWEQLKLLAFSRVICTIYGTSLLYVLLRIQLSVIGGYLLIEANKEKSQTRTDDQPTSVTGIDEHVQRKYLSLSNHLATVGITKMCFYIQEKVRSVVSQMPLKQTVTASDIEQTFWAIIRKDIAADENETKPSDVVDVLGNPTRYSWKYIFPDGLLRDQELLRDSEQVAFDTPDIYKKLLCETYDLLESDDTRGILSFFESHGVSHYVDRLSDCIKESNKVEIYDEEQTVFREPSVPLAKLIPPMNSLHLIDVLDDPWIHLLMTSDSVRVLSANIYEAFSFDAL